jgi:hypothetical protein
MQHDYMTRCYEHRNQATQFIGLRDCLEFGPPRRFSGIFISEFEGDRLLENANPAAAYAPRDHVSLVFDNHSDIKSAPGFPEHCDKPCSQIYQVDLIGRKARGPSGWIGLMDEVVVVDKLTVAKKLQEFQGYVPDSVLIRN